MDIQSLREFIAIAEKKDLSVVADQFFISPSTLSVHIRKIESELGYSLFNRTSRKMELNEQGQLFLGYAKNMLNTYDSYQLEAAKNPSKKEKGLTIGYSSSMAQILVADIISGFHREYKDIPLFFMSRDFSHLINTFLGNGTCSFVLSYNIEHASDSLGEKVLFKDHIAAVVSDKHRFFGKESISFEELKGECLLLQNTDHNIFSELLHHIHTFGFEPNIGISVNLEDTLMDLIECGAGVGLMPYRDAVRMQTEKVWVLDLEPEYEIKFSLFYKSTKKFTLAEFLFYQYIENLFKNDDESF